MKSIYLIALLSIVTGCTFQKQSSPVKEKITISIPVVRYFIEQITGGAIETNIMIPQSIGHSDYTPRPSQMISLSESKQYLAIGNLDFEITWKERLCSTNEDMEWVDLSKGIKLCQGHEGESTDPHYWMSPKEAKILARNIFDIFKNVENDTTYRTNYESLITRIEDYDRQLDSISRSSTDTITFMIYHPALTYLAHDYGFKQLEIEHEGNAPSMQTYKNEIEEAQAGNVSVVFVQVGFDMQKAETIAERIGAKVVAISPESENWDITMQTIINSLKR